MRKIKIIVLLLIVVFSGGLLYKYVFDPKGSPLIPVKTKVIQGSLNTYVTATGVIQPTEHVEVGTQVSGIVKNVYVDYNSTVKKGQLLAELDKNNLQQRLALAQSQYKDAKTALLYQRSIYQRSKVLYKEDLISLAEYQEAEFAHNNAISLVEQRSADVNTEQTNLSFADVYSPIDGVVLSREISEGQTVAATFNTPTLFTIAKDLKEMQVEANVDEADIGNVKIGQRVTFTVDAHPDETFQARVAQVRLKAKIDANVVSYTCILEADNSSGLLMPGMTATISIMTSEESHVLKLENKAFNYIPDLGELNDYIEKVYPNATTIDSLPRVREKNEKIIWVVEKDRIIPKTVITRASDGVYTQVLQGIQPGEVVLMGFENSKLNKSQKDSGK